MPLPSGALTVDHPDVAAAPDADRVAAAVQATRVACARYGLPQGSEHIRTAHYTALRVTGTPYLVRVSSADLEDEHRQEMAIARELARCGVSVTVPADALPDPLVTVNGQTVGFWDYVPHHPAAIPDGHQVGRLLRSLHDASPAVQVPLALFKNRDKVARRLDALEADKAASPDTLAYLRTELDLRAAAVEALPGAWGVIHGDYQPGNILVATDGPLVMIDLDTVCRAPLMWDLTSLEARCRRSEYPISFTAVLDGYGRDGIDMDALEVACRQRDLSTAVWAYNEHRRSPTPRYWKRAQDRLADVRVSPRRAA